jgi:TolA-binding protein
MRWLAVLLALMVAGPVLAQSAEEQLAAASALFEAKRYDQAAQRLEKFLAAHPKHAKAGAAALALGRAYAEQGQWAKAVPAYEKAVAAKDAGVATTAQLGLGEAAMRAGQYDKAYPALAAALKGDLTDQQEVVARGWLAESAFETKRYAEAEETYLQVARGERRGPVAADALYGAGLAALRQGKNDVARRRFEALVDRYEDTPAASRSRLALGQLDLEAKRWSDARERFETLLENADQRSVSGEMREVAEDGLIQALLELGEHRAALPRLEAAVRRLPANDPQRFRAHLSLGHCRTRQKQYEPALAAYREAAKSREEAVAAQGLYWCANTLLAQNKPAEAAAEFAKLPARYPKHELAARAQLRAGDALAAAKKADTAADAYRIVLAKYPQSPQAAEARKALGDLVDTVDDPAQLAAAARNAPPAERTRANLRLGRLAIQKKQWDQAVAPLKEVVAARPAAETLAEAQYLLGLAYEAQEKTEPAVVALTHAVAANSGAEWALDAQGRLAWLALELKRPVAAEKAANAVLAAKPEDEQARLALVQALLDQEKWDAALESSQPLLEGNPRPEAVAMVLFTQAWATEKRGSAEEAVPLWERLATEHPKSPYAADAFLRLGDADLKAERYPEAEARYRALLATGVKGAAAAEARFKLGSALYNQDKPADAAAHWDLVAADRQAGEYGAESLYWAGVALEKAGRKADAIKRLDRLITAHPKHARVATARTRLAALRAVTGQ